MCSSDLGRIINDTVRWPGGEAMSELSGRPIRLKFTLDNARLYTFEAKSNP